MAQVSNEVWVRANTKSIFKYGVLQVFIASKNLFLPYVSPFK